MIDAIAALQNAASAEAPAAPGGAKVDLPVDMARMPASRSRPFSQSRFFAVAPHGLTGPTSERQ